MARRCARPIPALLLTLLTGLSAPSAAQPAEPSPGIVAEVSVTASPARSRLTGHVRLTVRNDSRVALARIPLWRFPEHLRAPPARMDEVSEDWVYPAGPSPGGLTLGEVRDGGGRVLVTQPLTPTVSEVVLAEALAPGGLVSLDVPFHTRVPRRFGPFGVHDGRLTLDGGFFPRPPPLGPDGFVTSSPPGDFAWRLSLSVEGAPATAIAQGRVAAVAPGQRVDFGPGVSSRISLVLLEEHQESAMDHEGTRIRFLHTRTRRRAAGPDTIPDPTVIDTHAQTLATMASGLSYLKKTLGEGWTPPREILLVEAPLRRDIALAGQGMVLVSDRAFEVLAVERLQKFHRIALLRALFTQQLEGRIFAAEPVRWRDRVLDLIAVHLTERWEDERYGTVEGAQQLLQGGSFVAAVDDVIYAPQLPYQHVYFRTLDDTDPFRDHVTLFAHPHPNGRRLHEKLKDLTSAEGLVALVDRLLERERPPFATLVGQRIPAADAAFLAQWDREYPVVAYRLGEVRQGRDAEGPWVDVEVVREGDLTVSEPVTVKAFGSGAAPVTGTWHGPGPRGVVRLRTELERPKVIVDPMGRLYESDLGSNDDPRMDNRNYDDWKFLVQGFFFSFSSANGQLNGTLSSILQRKNDLGNLILLQPFELTTSTGVATTWIAGFGDKVRPNRRGHYVQTHLTLERLKASETVDSGFGAIASVGVGTSDYISRVTPMQGRTLYAGVGGLFSATGGDPDIAVFGQLDAARLFRLTSADVLGVHGAANLLLGEASEQQKWQIGGPGLVRAFDPVAALGRHRVLASVEWRHRFTRDMNLNIVQAGWVYGLHGVAFVDAALLSDDLDALPSSRSLYAGAGYGLRFVYLLFGMNPMLLSFDVGVPLYAGGRPPLDVTAPVSLVVSVDQAF